MAEPQLPSMSGKTCIVTGANSGIGLETARELARMGAKVVLVCRNPEKGRTTIADIQAAVPAAQLDLLIADMSSLASVRGLGAEILGKYPRVDVLINNAGTAISKRSLSVDGVEMTVAGNHLGAFLLTLLLLDRLKASAPARIINVSSEAQRRAVLDMDDIQFERRKYSGIGAYGQSKVLMNACTFELARRLAGTGVTVNCLHPGVVATNIWHSGEADQPLFFKILVRIFKPFMLDSKKGAEVTLYLATSPSVEKVTGEYFVKSKPAECNAIERDPKAAAAIWQWSEKMTGARLA
ncbi:MAG TPA: SDR family oxidoreductase [Candidatus Baltobacteraceae bacterium]|nr:SDR family oxidoreductase [Candidatus Baltobacteraceae bacterium]